MEEKGTNSNYQNTGVTMESITEDVTKIYYGRIKDIWEPGYLGEKVPMFHVRWAKKVDIDSSYFTTMYIPDDKSNSAKVPAKYEPWVLAKH